MLHPSIQYLFLWDAGSPVRRAALWRPSKDYPSSARKYGSVSDALASGDSIQLYLHIATIPFYVFWNIRCVLANIPLLLE